MGKQILQLSGYALNGLATAWRNLTEEYKMLTDDDMRVGYLQNKLASQYTLRRDANILTVCGSPPLRFQL